MPWIPDVAFFKLCGHLYYCIDTIRPWHHCIICSDLLHYRVKRSFLKCLSNSILLNGKSSYSFLFLISKMPWIEICHNSSETFPKITISTMEAVYLISTQIQCRFKFHPPVSKKSSPDWLSKLPLPCKSFRAWFSAQPLEKEGGRRSRLQACPPREALVGMVSGSLVLHSKGLIFIFWFCFRFWDIISIITFFPVQRFLMHVLFILERSFMLLCEFQFLRLILISFKAVGHFSVGV